MDARYIIKRYDEIIDEISETNNTYVDYLTYDYLNTSTDFKTFRLLYKPAPGTLRFFVNGVAYAEGTGAFTYDETDNSITWIFTEANGGYNLKPEYTYMAIYDYYISDNLSYASVEKAVNALILINPDLLRTDFDYDRSKEKMLVQYIARQISKGNLAYKAMLALYPDLAKDIGNAILTLEGRNDYLTDALNVLLLVNPKLLYNEDLDENNFDRELIIKYIKQQMEVGAIDEQEFYDRYPHMYRLLNTNVTDLGKIIKENELDKKYPNQFNDSFYTNQIEDKDE